MFLTEAMKMTLNQAEFLKFNPMSLEEGTNW
jgi:hypothetical protein